jgi:serine/threonine-protein kinase HipA
VEQVAIYTDASGHIIYAARIEEAYLGNYYLLANIDGKQYKHIIRSGTPEHDAIGRLGSMNIPPEKLRQMVERYLVPKAER